MGRSREKQTRQAHVFLSAGIRPSEPFLTSLKLRFQTAFRSLI
ncbi:hypothetical protein HMPREF9120_01647 [Neisseria sp. oral taxon 020 str. F0370]|nr:hypothetical protein HMPREF9120_01647 [Neisseria sp. oral taxon 020 str. F0370]